MRFHGIHLALTFQWEIISYKPCLDDPAREKRQRGRGGDQKVGLRIGDLSEMASRTTLARLTQGGFIPVSTNVVAGEFQRS